MPMHCAEHGPVRSRRCRGTSRPQPPLPAIRDRRHDRPGRGHPGVRAAPAGALAPAVCTQSADPPPPPVTSTTAQGHRRARTAPWRWSPADRRRGSAAARSVELRFVLGQLSGGDVDVRPRSEHRIVGSAGCLSVGQVPRRWRQGGRRRGGARRPLLAAPRAAVVPPPRLLLSWDGAGVEGRPVAAGLPVVQHRPQRPLPPPPASGGGSVCRRRPGDPLPGHSTPAPRTPSRRRMVPTGLDSPRNQAWYV